MRVPALLAALSLAACSSGIKLPALSMPGTADGLSYAEVQSVHPGVTAAQVRDAFGDPLATARRDDGSVERMEYVALDAKGDRHRLVLDFDGKGVLVGKQFTGPVLRP